MNFLISWLHITEIKHINALDYIYFVRQAHHHPILRPSEQLQPIYERGNFEDVTPQPYTNTPSSPDSPTSSSPLASRSLNCASPSPRTVRGAASFPPIKEEAAGLRLGAIPCSGVCCCCCCCCVLCQWRMTMMMMMACCGPPRTASPCSVSAFPPSRVCGLRRWAVRGSSLPFLPRRFCGRSRRVGRWCRVLRGLLFCRGSFRYRSFLALGLRSRGWWFRRRKHRWGGGYNCCVRARGRH